MMSRQATKEVFEVLTAYRPTWRLARDLAAVLTHHGVANADAYGDALAGTMYAVLEDMEIERATDAAPWPEDARATLSEVQDRIYRQMREVARRGGHDALMDLYWAFVLVGFARDMYVWPIRSSAWVAAAMDVYAMAFGRGIRNEARMLPRLMGADTGTE